MKGHRTRFRENLPLLRGPAVMKKLPFLMRAHWSRVKLRGVERVFPWRNKPPKNRLERHMTLTYKYAWSVFQVKILGAFYRGWFVLGGILTKTHQNWPNLASSILNFCRNDAQIRVIGQMEPEICTKMLKKLSEKLRAKLPATTPGCSMVKIARLDEAFLEVF